MAKWPYGTARWAALRRARLDAEPLCRYCLEFDPERPVPADTVDHIKPHRGDYNLAFHYDNTQSLCKPCHDKHAQIKDTTGVAPGCDADGYPRGWE